MRIIKAITTCFLIGTTLMATPASATRSREDYRYFRALSIDLEGRIPTRDEMTAFEADSFNVEAWIDARLHEPGYAARVSQVYMDLLRLRETGTFVFNPPATNLRSVQVQGSDGAPIYIYYRSQQRRARAETDGGFCLTYAEAGIQLPKGGRSSPMCTNLHPVAPATLAMYTRQVRPWWMYRDYRSANPTQRITATGPGAVPGFEPVTSLMNDPMGHPVDRIYVCAEEAGTSATGTLSAPRHRRPAATGCDVQLASLPNDNAYAVAHVGEAVSCATPLAFSASSDCGCGVGLERCMPGTQPSLQSPVLTHSDRTPLGTSLPFDVSTQSQGDWERYWWAQEAEHIVDYVLAGDRDFREVLTTHTSMVNGPLAQFYRSLSAHTLSTPIELAYDYLAPTPLFDASHIPASVLPYDVETWTQVDRGPRASGLLTTPIFLSKYGTRRARAHVLYNAFMCRDFVAGNVMLTPSSEPNLMIRPGCATCHATLEPLAAYFSRVVESDWNYLDPAHFPLNNARCAAADPESMPLSCRNFYDPSFTTATMSQLRGSYASSANADAGPAGIAAQITSAPGFASCIATNVAQSFLGRTLTEEDSALLTQLSMSLSGNSYHMRSLVRALVLSDAYRHSNNLSSTTWRMGAN